jgi:hypothetical protein
MAVWSSLWYLLIFFPIWYVRAKITLATLKRMCSSFIFFLARSKKKSNAFFLIDLICRLSEQTQALCSRISRSWSWWCCQLGRGWWGLRSVYTNMIFVSDVTAACDSRIQHRIKDRINLIFCAVPDAAVASDTENHGSCKQTFREPVVCPVGRHKGLYTRTMKSCRDAAWHTDRIDSNSVARHGATKNHCSCT